MKWYCRINEECNCVYTNVQKEGVSCRGEASGLHELLEVHDAVSLDVHLADELLQRVVVLAAAEHRAQGLRGDEPAAVLEPARSEGWSRPRCGAELIRILDTTETPLKHLEQYWNIRNHPKHE